MGQRKTDVALAYQADYSTLYRWCQRCIRQQDFSELERKSGSGRPNILDFNHRKQLAEIVMKPASIFGYGTDFWTCRRLIQVTETQLKFLSACDAQAGRISQPTMWRLLRDMGLTYLPVRDRTQTGQKPERRYFEANEQQRKNWIRYEIPRRQDIYEL
ncbi:MAG: hypothetical protein NUV74_11485 [Candidatus Brocadiaceae bacterium]|nr:hypothetical protein [Candidatus Brocadiaceae bacterium]